MRVVTLLVMAVALAMPGPDGPPLGVLASVQGHLVQGKLAQGKLAQGTHPALTSSSVPLASDPNDRQLRPQPPSGSADVAAGGSRWLDLVAGFLSRQQILAGFGLGGGRGGVGLAATTGTPDDVYDNDNEPESSLMDLSQYEDEIVVRFGWSEPEDGAAFVRATETLVLDLWRLDTWSGDVRLPRKRLRDLMKLLPRPVRASAVEYVTDLEMAVLSTLPLPLPAGPAVSGDFFGDFRPLRDIYTYLDELAATNRHVSVVDIGTTHEGRPVRAVRLGHRSGPTSLAKKIVVLAGSAGRDWASVATALYVLQTIASQPMSSLDAIELHFVPLLNPDGYAYSWTHDRLWRKNRQPTAVAMCSGLDLDSAFGSAADGSWPLAMAKNPCSEHYAGTAELEAREVAHLTHYLAQLGDVDGVLAFSSYGSRVISGSDPHADPALARFCRRISIQTGKDYEHVAAAMPLANGARTYTVQLDDTDRQGLLVTKRRIAELGNDGFRMLSEFARL